MKILWSSNAMWAATGYGIQAQHLLPRFRDAGHEVAQFAWYGLQGGIINAGGIKIYPKGRDAFGADVIRDHVKDFGADVVISLQDVWPLPDDYGQRCGVPWVCWFPVDHDPLPDKIKSKMPHVDYPVVYSKFGRMVAQEAGIDTIYIPHGIDPKVYKPLGPDETKEDIRRRLHLPEDVFLVSMVAANKSYPSRKAFPECLEAFALFREEFPRAFLYLHTEIHRDIGINLLDLCEKLGITDCVKFPQHYHYVVGGIPPQYLADIYRCSDVLLAASMGEGFGVPIAEAQACGCPVITTAFSSMPELTIHGQSVDDFQRFWTPLGSWQVIPSINAIRDALVRVYDYPSDRKTKAQAAVEHFHKNYSWDYLVEKYWLPFLARVADEKVRVVNNKLAMRDLTLKRSDADEWYNQARMKTFEVLVKLASQSLDRYSATVVDLGCGTGEAMEVLYESGYDPGRVWGVDISGRRIERARESLQKYGPKFMQRDVRDVDLDDEEADLVVCLETIEHIPDSPSPLWTEIRRILKPGGFLIMSTVNDFDGDYVDRIEHFRGYSLATLTAEAQDQGFNVIAATSTPPNIFGPRGLLNNPETLGEYKRTLEDTKWEVQTGSNLYIMAQKMELKEGEDGSGGDDFPLP